MEHVLISCMRPLVPFSVPSLPKRVVSIRCGVRPLILALETQVSESEFEASLMYTVRPFLKKSKHIRELTG